MSDGRNLLTHSRTQCMRTCLRKHFLSYELGIRKDVKAAPLRMGKAFHKGKELVWNGSDVESAVLEALKPYQNVPANCDLAAWAIEREKVYRLLWAYFQVWADETKAREVVAAELPFELPIINPETGGRTNAFLMAGKIDAIVKLPDGRLAVEETKTTSRDLSPDSDYWNRLRVDDQITRYFYAARKLGFNVSCVIYDVIRKPQTEPNQVSLLDENGDKIVLDQAGQRVFKKDKQPRQTGDKDLGYVLQVRRETPEEYGDRLSQDISERPEFYFARREIARLDSDIAEFEAELWQSQQMLRDCQRTGRWFRNSNACLQPYRCEFAEMCFGGWNKGEPLPAGYKQVQNVNPELEEEGE